VQLRVEDSGIGMDEETRQRVFEPFSTTKATVDVGLGLSMAYGTVTGWGGDIRVESAPGKGSAFTLSLPVWQETGEEENPSASRNRILIVEDDDSVGQLLRRLLEGRYEVALATSGSQALATRQSCDLALVDLGMPGMRGDRVALALKQADPAVATVLITGWDSLPEDLPEEAFDFRLQKPFEDLEEVEKTIEKALALRQTRVAELTAARR
jgi:CheY-like chemotaxis protein